MMLFSLLLWPRSLLLHRFTCRLSWSWLEAPGLVVLGGFPAGCDWTEVEGVGLQTEGGADVIRWGENGARCSGEDRCWWGGGAGYGRPWECGHKWVCVRNQSPRETDKHRWVLVSGRKCQNCWVEAHGSAWMHWIKPVTDEHASTHTHPHTRCVRCLRVHQPCTLWPLSAFTAQSSVWSSPHSQHTYCTTSHCIRTVILIYV